jgi:Response regulators consisting of a CheY-like receiver domain and a winged-helix DNA-binding domain
MRILMIEDDIKLGKAMSLYLKHAGYSVDFCDRGDDGLEFVRREIYDLVILDRLLPGLDGLDLLKQLRKDGIMAPVIMVTALNQLNDRIDGFDWGADDYLGKPFAMEELLVRTRALLRRPFTMKENTLISCSNIQLDVIQKLLISDTARCELSRKEAALMELFISNHNQILPRELILQKVWGPESYVGDGNLDNYISFLRRRLKKVGARCQISTIHSIGYRLEI